MKIEWHEEDFENEKDSPEETTKSPKNDTLDKYSEEMARDAVGRLFDEGEDDGEEDDEPVVTGFDRPAPGEEPRKETRAVKFDREKVPGPRVEDVINGDEIPPRKRARAREANPVPRPAVRYAPPPPRERRTVRTAPVSPEAAGDYEEAEGGMEEDINTFRKRYKPSPGEPAPARKTESAPRPRVERHTPVRSARLHYDDVADAEDEDRISPLRWIFTAAAFVLLLITAFLTYQVNTLSKELANSNAALAASPDAKTLTEAQLANEQLTTELAEKDAEIVRLQSVIDGMGASGSGDGPTFGLDDTPEGGGVSAPVASGEENPAASSAGQAYTVVRGDSLSRIAQRFYGSQRPEFINKIMAANNMTETGINIGDILTIPPQ